MITLLPIAALETVFNQYLKLDPDMFAQLAKFEGKVMAVEGSDIPLKLFFLPTSHGVRIMQHYEDEPDAILKGDLFSLARLGLTNDPQKVRQLFTGDVSITGDSEFGQEFKKVLDNIDIDWEEQIAKLLGDIPAHQIGNFLRSTFSWQQECQSNMQQSVTEYLQEEARSLPPREEVEDFFNDIDDLRSDADRLEARFLQWRNKR